MLVTLLRNRNGFGNVKSTVAASTLKSLPYKYSLVATSSVMSSVAGTTGATLTF